MSSANLSKENQFNLPGVRSRQQEPQGVLPGLNDNGQKAPASNSDNFYLSCYQLDHNDILKLKVFDSYGVHRIVYDLFEPGRQPGEQTSAGILHADLGEKKGKRQILILSNREPAIPLYGKIEKKVIPDVFFDYKTYRFAITINPVKRNNQSGKIEPIKGRDAIESWFMEKAGSYGFDVVPRSIQNMDIKVDKFKKGDSYVILAKANINGLLEVTDKELFSRAVHHGLGRGKAFGCGLLRLVPVKL